MRVGGRLTYAPISYDRKFPILLPSQSLFTEIIINYHLHYLHVGIQTVHFLILQQFWILSAKLTMAWFYQNAFGIGKRNPWQLHPL